MSTRLPPVTASIPFAAETLTVPEPSLPGWEEAVLRVIAYLTACGVTDNSQVIELIHAVKQCMAGRLPLPPDASLLALAIEETGRVIDEWLIRELALEHPHDRGQMLAAVRAALLSNPVPAWPKNGLQAVPGSMAAAIQTVMVVPVPPKNGLVIKPQAIRLRPMSLRRFMRRLLRWLRARS